MFSNVGWFEIIAVAVLAFIVVGPERLPGIVDDVRAGLIAARRAIDNVKAELDDELGEELTDLATPIRQLATYRGMGPKAALTKTLLDGDRSFAEALDVKKQVRDDLGPRPTLGYEPETARTPQSPTSPTQPPAPADGLDFSDVI